MKQVLIISIIFNVLLIVPDFQDTDYEQSMNNSSSPGSLYKGPTGIKIEGKYPYFTYVRFENDSSFTSWNSTASYHPKHISNNKNYIFRYINDHLIEYTDKDKLDNPPISSKDDNATIKSDTAIVYHKGYYLYLDSVIFRSIETPYARHDTKEMSNKQYMLYYMFQNPTLPNTLKFVFQDSQHRKIILLLGGKHMTVMCLSDLFAPIIEEYEIALVTERYAIGVDIGKCISTNRPGSVSARPTLRPFRDPSNLSAENALPSFEGKSFTAYWRNGLVLSDVSLEDFLFTRDKCTVLDDIDTIEIDPALRDKFFKYY